ncbi:MAG: CHAT domain-containing protein [Candidatus Polarisedimenticolia bacterium]
MHLRVAGAVWGRRLLTGVLMLGLMGPVPAQSPGTDAPPEATWYAEALVEFQAIRSDPRRLPEAEAAGKTLLALTVERLGADSAEAIEVRGLLSRTLIDMGKKRAPEAASLAQEALASADRLYSGQDPRLRQPLKDLGNALEYVGSFAESRAVRVRLLDLCEALADPMDACIGDALADLGMITRQLGDFSGARLYFERALAAHEARNPNDARSDIGQVLYALSGVCRQEGDIDQALAFAERGARFLEEVSSPFLNVMLNQLAAIYRDLGRYAESRDLLDRCLREWRKLQGEEGPNVLTALSSQALVMSRLGEHAAARSQAEQALQTYARRVPPEDRTLAPFLRNLALVHVDDGQDALAEPLVEKALRVKELAYGPHHDSLATLLDLLAGIEYRLGRYDESMEHAMRAESITRANFHDVTTVLSERQAYRYEASHASSLRFVLSALSRPGSPRNAGLIEKAWDDVVLSRALVLDEIASRARATAELQEPAVAALVGELQAVKSRLATLALQGQGPGGAPGTGPVAEAQASKERLERELASRSAEYRRGRARRETHLSDVRAALPPDAALLAYVEFDRLADAGSSAPSASSYGAFVLAPSSREPQFFSLGSAREIEALVQAWRETASRELSGREPLMGNSERAYREAGRLLREKIWDPLAAAIGGAKKVFVVPDGALHLVNIATLPAGEDRYLIESEPLLHHLSTERDLVRRAARPNPSASALILGAPDLDASPATAPVTGVAAADPRPVPSRVRGAASRPACGNFRSLRFGALPATRAEISDVASLVNAKLRAVELTGPKATEAAFKSMAPGRRILHIATHGFFLQDVCPSALESARAQGTGTAAALSEVPVIRGAADNPLLLSGLALTGANKRGEIPAADTGAEDGMLTAEEVGALDLSGTEWAVLSACETGVGKVLPGEGVLGLRRAFAVAGVGTLIMSLWQVDDEATRLWMKGLYEGRLTGRSTADSVREASLAMIKKNRDRGRTTHPFFWGGFVAEGDWR